jgi:hypothetical protein
LGGYVVAVFHHPLDWLSANTKRNNKQRFEEHLIKSANFAIFGHEHDSGKGKSIFQDKQNVIFCGGKAFATKSSENVGFSYYEIDLTNNESKLKTYLLNEGNYVLDYEADHTLITKEKRKFNLIDEFDRHLCELNVPLKHSKKDKLLLSDIFVFPDLEPLIESDIVQYPNSEILIEYARRGSNSKILIEGADQSGKTSLLFTLYKRYYEMGLTPVYLKGKDCNDTNIKTLIKKALKEQYSNDNVDLFFQLPTRVLVVDNFQKSNLNGKYKKKLIDSFNEHFHLIILTTDNTYNSRNVTEEVTSLREYEKYKLLPLGHEKRSELIEQWLVIGQNKLTVQEEVIIEEVKLRFHEIDSLIGNRLMPSYPIFILSLLQGLEENLQNFSQTSYANIYLVLIKAGLIKEGIKDELLTSVLNILKELSYYLFSVVKSNSFSYSDFEKFILLYNAKYFKHQNLTSEKILSSLTNSNILKVDDEYYSFAYKYIYYFLIAQKISSEIESHKDLIYELCNNIHLELNANILIFLSHHSKAQILIDNIVFTSQIPFAKFSSIKLEKNDEFVTFLTEFTREIKAEIIEEINPKEEIRKDLREKDHRDRNGIKSIENEEFEDSSDDNIEISQAFRSVKIIGQIVKNQSGDFEKDKLINLVESAYNTIFRLLGFYSEILVKSKDLIIESVVENMNEKVISRKGLPVDVKEVEKAIRKLLQLISWRICVDSMSTLMYAVGAKGQNELYDQVDKRINTTASKLVTFVIKTHNDKINIKELSNLFSEIKDNFLAQSILREYVKRYLYTTYMDTNKRDQIIQIAGFRKPKLIPNLAKKK